MFYEFWLTKVIPDSAYPPQEDSRMFPYNVAGVCTLWKSVSSQFPAFWRRLIFSVELSGYTIVDALSHAAHVLRSPKTMVLSIKTLNAANCEDDVMDIILSELFETLSVPREIEKVEETEETKESRWLSSYNLDNLALDGYVLPYEQQEDALSQDMTLFLQSLSRSALRVFMEFLFRLMFV